MRQTRHKLGQWAAACRDIARRRREILVVPTEDQRVALIVPPGEAAVLEPLEVGRLRAALRDVVLALDHTRTPEQREQGTQPVQVSV
ncbi:hypothetical protein [Gandjariella thermophila]|uniref:Antitoxin n=1 Tax=Gandjariella thermophila TaxID=1931992 RepID=A0A4D4JHZ1_9PSEU|nr:hypothetical protein [Gandjariella thermophila]GDY33889.1 hypothetical protein GTS_55220 [Gandjariella thermophila]